MRTRMRLWVRTRCFPALVLAAVTLIAGCGVAPGGGSTPPTATATGVPGREGVPDFRHVFLIVMENLGYRDALKQPYIASLARRYAVATRYYATAHPSLPNYLSLVAGHTLVSSDCWFCYQNAPNLATQLTTAKRSWAAYLEGLPRPCWTGPWWFGGYAGKHNPFRYFTDVRGTRTAACHLQPASVLSASLARGKPLPDFIWITPNLCHDMHSCPPADGDRWLASFVPRILASRAWRDGGVLFITWDEAAGSDRSACCGLTEGGGHVLTLVLAPGLPSGLRVSVPYDHYSLLRTVEDAWGLGYVGLAGAPKTRALSDFWRYGKQ